MKYAINANKLANGIAALNLLDLEYTKEGIAYISDANFNPDHPYIVVYVSSHITDQDMELLRQYGTFDTAILKTKESPRYSGAME